VCREGELIDCLMHMDDPLAKSDYYTMMKRIRLMERRFEQQEQRLLEAIEGRKVVTGHSGKTSTAHVPLKVDSMKVYDDSEPMKVYDDSEPMKGYDTVMVNPLAQCVGNVTDDSDYNVTIKTVNDLSPLLGSVQVELGESFPQLDGSSGISVTKMNEDDQNECQQKSINGKQLAYGEVMRLKEQVDLKAALVRVVEQILPRYDFDQSGTINGYDELTQLTTCVVVRSASSQSLSRSSSLQPLVVSKSGGNLNHDTIEGAIGKMMVGKRGDLKNRPMDVGEYVEWLFEAFKIVPAVPPSHPTLLRSNTSL